jgi:hypothetical protein
MLQMRPNGWCLDHYHIALDGTVLETKVVAMSVFRAPVLAKSRLMYQAWPRNRRYVGIILVFTDDKGEIKSVFASIKEMSMKSASTRYDVVAGSNGRMWLEHQALPGTAEASTSKPTFAG